MYIEIDDKFASAIRSILADDCESFELFYNRELGSDAFVNSFDCYHAVRCVIDAIDEKIADSL